MRSSSTQGTTRIERLAVQVDVNLATSECISICQCKADGVRLTELKQFDPVAKETVAQRRDRRARISKAIHDGSVLPIDVGIGGVFIRFVLRPINAQEEQSWLGKSSGFLDATSGFLAIEDHIVQLPADRYQANVYCYVPSRCAVSRLAATVAGWDESLNLVDNLNQFWKSTRKYKCEWTKKSLQQAVAVIVQLTPTSLEEQSFVASDVKEYGARQLALKWSLRTLPSCPDFIEPCFEEQEEGDQWEIESVDVPGPRKKPAANSADEQTTHPVYPILLSDDDLKQFREQLVSLVFAARKGPRFEPHKVVPRMTKNTLKEFDYLAEDSQLYPRLMLVLACTQIECGYIESAVADEALNCIPTMERVYKLDLKGAQQKKALRELRKLREEIEQFRDM
ncbi:MAG: hypothetical protein KDB22_25810 [Planctomycetales bacterium]|nr:hypothetical protein [Planctomycetales bacterium]